MSFASALVLLAVTVASTTARTNEYCSISRDHTMCKYEGIGPACEKVGAGDITEADKAHIVDLHNYYRRLVATGHESRGKPGPQPTAANLRKMSWDDELARVAQRWADQCTFEHDAVRDVKRWKVGQNLYWSWRQPVVPEANWTAAVASWYEEVTLFDSNTVGSYKFNSATGHYTQVLWADTYLVGCGRRNYGPNKIYVCNYGPAGNWLRDPMYIVGNTCSRCPKGTTCEDGLCVGTPGNTPKGQEKNPNAQAPARRPAQSRPQNQPPQQHLYQHSEPILRPTPGRKPTGQTSYRPNKQHDSTAERFNQINAN